MPARREPVPPDPDPEEALLAALRRWQTAAGVYETAKAAHEAARRDLVAVLHDLGVVGFSL